MRTWLARRLVSIAHLLARTGPDWDYFEIGASSTKVDGHPLYATYWSTGYDLLPGLVIVGPKRSDICCVRHDRRLDFIRVTLTGCHNHRGSEEFQARMANLLQKTNHSGSR